ncbi:ABC transporter ATP-binding protein [uncultured Abyssibacter sp.]|uniref:ABC transporter ATP-binding protein n=1 Tax=uncultured Abyssibacter sp. TaxID=2320202 RepID=UPI0032B23670
MTQAIRVEGVEKRYGALHALKGVSFGIEQGEYFGLLGPNGAGKSTLINITAGLVRASGGHVSVMGHDVVGAFRPARQSLGVVPQEIVYDPFFSVRDILRIQAGYFGCGREAWPWIEELLERLDLTDKCEASIRQLSGGMKRRVLIAQALVHRPPVVILDEPTAGVDVELRRTLWEFTRELHAAGHTIVLTTHYLEEAEALCERIAIMDHGELKALEKTGDFLARHPFRFLRLSIDGPGTVPPAIERLVCARDNDELELRLTRGQDSVADVLDGLRDAGFRVTDVHTREPSLEDIFVELTGDSDE